MPPMQYTPSVGTTIALLVADCLSILSCCFVVVAFMKIKLLRRHPSSLIRDRCIADAIFSLVTAAGHLYFRLGQSSASGSGSSPGYYTYGSVDCKAFSFITMATTLAAEMYFAAMTVDLHISMTNPFTNWKRNLRWYHGVTIAVSLAAATALVTARFDGDRSYGRDNFLAVCWVRNFSDNGSLATSFWVFFLVPLIIIYTTALTMLAQASRRLRQGLPETFEARVEIFRSTLRFNLSYVAFWVVAVSVYTLISVIDYQHPSDFLSLLLALSLGSKGTVTTVIWLLTFGKDLTCTCKRGCVPRQLLNAPASKSGSGGNADDAADLRPFLNVSLRREVLYYTTLGIAKSVARVAREGAPGAGAGAGAGPSSDVGLDEEYSPAHGIRANVLLLSRRKEELGLFDLEANKRRAQELVAAQSQRYASLPSGAGSSSSRSRTDAGAGSSSRRSAPTSLTSVADSVAGGAASPFATASRIAPPPAIAAAAILPVGAALDSHRLVVGSSSGPTLPTSGMHSINRSPAPVQRSASDLTVPLLSPARESEVQELYRQGQGTGTEWGVSSDRDRDRDRAKASRSTGSARLAALRGAQQRGSSSGAGAGGGAGAGTVSRTQRSSRSGAGASAGAAASAAETAASAAAAAVRDAQRMARGRRGCCSSLCGWLCEGSAALQRHRFVDVEPFLFRRLRLQAGISDSDYVLALSRTRREKFSEGASSQFFYYSTDERMLVKTLDGDEVQVLVSMLHAYSRYMSANPHSLLPRFFGLHSITMYGHTFHFCVMANVLATGSTSVQDRYDLKGSWVNRGRRPLEKGEKADCRYCGMRFRVGEGGNRFATEGSGRYACPARVNRPHEPNVILKDNDLNAKLRLAPQTAQALGDQIAGDADFLRAHGITDYSLLLGVHRTRYKLMDAQTAAGGLPGVGSGSGSGAGSAAGMSAGAGAGAGSGAGSSSAVGVGVHTLHSHGGHGGPAAEAGGGSGIASLGGVPSGSGAGAQPSAAIVAVASPHLGAQHSSNSTGAGMPPHLSLSLSLAGGNGSRGGAGTGHTPDSVAVLMAPTPTPGSSSGAASATNADAEMAGFGAGQRVGGSGHLSIHRPTSGKGAGAAASSSHRAGSATGAAGGAAGGGEGEATPAWGIDLPLSDIMGSPGSPGSFPLPRHIQAQLGASASASASAAAAGGVDSSLHTLAADMSALPEVTGAESGSRHGSSRSGDELGSAGDAAAAAAAEQRRAAGLGLADEEDIGGGVYRDEDDDAPGAADSSALPAMSTAALHAASTASVLGPPHSNAVMRLSSQSSARASVYDGGRNAATQGALSNGDSALSRLPGAGLATIGSGGSSGPDDALQGAALCGDSHVVPFFKQYRGGLRATVIEAPSLYYLGIIDILGRYTWSKWLERQIKIYLLFKSGAGISAMDPENYAQRFRTRVLAQMLDGWIDQAHAPHEL